MRFSSLKHRGQMFDAALTVRASRKETFSGGSKKEERTEIIKLAASISLAASWRRRRDLNPRGGFIHPTPLAGEPLRPLGYFCKSYEIKKCGGESGIRTNGHLRVAGFQDRFLQPLGHLSITGGCPPLEHLWYNSISSGGLSTEIPKFLTRKNFEKNEKRCCILLQGVLL